MHSFFFFFFFPGLKIQLVIQLYERSAAESLYEMSAGLIQFRRVTTVSVRRV